MATLCRRTGRSPGYEIRFYDPHGRRLTLYLGCKYSEKTAQELKEVIEKLVYFRNNSITIPDKKVLVWLEAASPEIRKKLGKAGLIEVPETHTLKELWDTFLKTKNNMKDSTLKSYELVRSRFFKFFGENETLTDLTQERLIQWKDSLTEQLATASVATHLKQTKACLTWAAKQSWIEKSPLDGVGRGDFRNKKNDRIISMQEYYFDCIIKFCL